MRSRTPPCPGMRRPESLTPDARLMSDSLRSPRSDDRGRDGDQQAVAHAQPRHHRRARHKHDNQARPPDRPRRPRQSSSGDTAGIQLVAPERASGEIRARVVAERQRDGQQHPGPPGAASRCRIASGAVSSPQVEDAEPPQTPSRARGAVDVAGVEQHDRGGRDEPPPRIQTVGQARRPGKSRRSAQPRPRSAATRRPAPTFRAA